MNAINFEATEMKSTATENIVRFPNFKPTAKETGVKVMSFVNTPNVLVRNRIAEEYIKSRKRKSAKAELGYALSAISVFASIIAMYFLLCVV